jgi:hypothetical protein
MLNPNQSYFHVVLGFLNSTGTEDDWIAYELSDLDHAVFDGIVFQQQFPGLFFTVLVH